jgi:hypothetical protein
MMFLLHDLEQQLQSFASQRITPRIVIVETPLERFDGITQYIPEHFLPA